MRGMPGLLFFIFGTIAFLQLGIRLELAVALLLVAVLSCISVTDLRHLIIPDRAVIPAMVSFFVLRLFIHPLPIWQYWLGFLVGGGFLLLLAIGSRGGMGGGDIKLMAMAGLVLGWKHVLLAIFLSAWLALVVTGIVWLAGRWRGRTGQTIRKGIPFGPYLAVGTFIAYLWGDVLLDLYLQLFF